jgi:phosphatidylinositol glycan class B
MNLSLKSRQYILIGLITHLLAVYFSVGFFNLDEQTQVLQLVGYKLGNYDLSYLSSQYTMALRSWLHPAIFLWCSKFLLLFFPFNPFVHALFHRLLSSSLGVISLFTLYKIFEDEIKEYKSEELFIFLTAMMWFFPFLHARPMNENLSISFFIFGLYQLRKNKTYTGFFIAGILFAVTFVIRFQVVVMIASTVLWFIIFQKKIKEVAFLVIGFLMALALSTLFDAYMYGHFTFTPYNYFYISIIQKYADTFGITPWYQYFIFTFRECLPPLAIMTIFSYLYLWGKFPKHLVTWITLPFFIVHSLIGHKEFRFIFPMAPFLPMILLLVLHSLKWQHKKNVYRIFLIFNVPLLIYFSFTPAANSNRYYKYLYDREIPVEKVYVFSSYDDNSKFYLKNDVEYAIIKPDEISLKVRSNARTYFLTKNTIERDLLLHEKQCAIGFSLYPNWIYNLSFIKKRRTFRSWSFIECIN